MRRMSVQDWELSNLVMGSCHRPGYRYKRKKQFQGHRKHRETDILKKSHENYNYKTVWYTVNGDLNDIFS